MQLLQQIEYEPVKQKFELTARNEKGEEFSSVQPVSFSENSEDEEKDDDNFRKIKKIYKIIGIGIEDAEELEDDEDKKRRIESVVVRNYAKQQTSTPKQNLEKEKYSTKPQTSMELKGSLSTSAYVCAPGSKAMCNTCPVYNVRSRLPNNATAQDFLSEFGNYLKSRWPQRENNLLARL